MPKNTKKECKFTESFSQIKSRKRVADHGEVFTNPHEVNAMLDLVKDESYRIDSKFLEPACGEGNFLIEILHRKLVSVLEKYKKSHSDYEKYAFLTATSMYGIELLSDNAVLCRKRLFKYWNDEYTKICKNDTSDECREAVRYVFERNILCGNALTLKKVDENTKDTDEPIIFAEWSFVTGNLIKRRDFRLDEMIAGHGTDQGEFSLFMNDWEYDKETKAFIPKPIKEYPLIDYRKVQENG